MRVKKLNTTSFGLEGSIGMRRRRFVYKRQSDPHLRKVHSWFAKAGKGTLTKEEIEVAFQDDPELIALLMKFSRLMELFEAMDAGEMFRRLCHQGLERPRAALSDGTCGVRLKEKGAVR